MNEILRLASILLRKRKKAQRGEVRQRDADLLERTGIRTPPFACIPAKPQAASVEILSRPRDCYICKLPFTRLHPFYDRLCPDCGDFNFARRTQSADLSGRLALLTGGRVKIGFAIGLKLLRAGGRLIITTRFPHDAAKRYAAEPDAESWAERLTIHGLDLRHLPAVEMYARTLTATQPHLDIFIHNAAQTVRRPPPFYRHLLDGERSADLPSLARGMLGQPWETTSAALPSTGERPSDKLAPVAGRWAELSQLPLLPGDAAIDVNSFPPGALDADAQQVDLREQNSWGLALREVSTVELLETQAVNSLSPFLLLRTLEPMLRAGPERDRYVVLVSAAEGLFEEMGKTGRHPHTNMAKAALNMLTRTCAADYAADRIFLTSVDTGWVSNQAAAPTAERMSEQGFRPPLDAEDGAARVLDPIFTGIKTGENLSGVFLKDYRPRPW